MPFFYIWTGMTFWIPRIKEGGMNGGRTIGKRKVGKSDFTPL
jgi:hypothetical protein